MAKTPLYTEKANTLISKAKELDRFCQAIEQSQFKLPIASAEDIRASAHAIVHEADTMALPKRLIPAARAIGDGAYLIERLFTQGRTQDIERVGIDPESYQESRAYVHKALQALKGPARFYGADTEALDMTGGLYL